MTGSNEGTFAAASKNSFPRLYSFAISAESPTARVDSFGVYLLIFTAGDRKSGDFLPAKYRKPKSLGANHNSVNAKSTSEDLLLFGGGRGSVLASP